AAGTDPSDPARGPEPERRTPEDVVESAQAATDPGPEPLAAGAAVAHLEPRPAGSFAPQGDAAPGVAVGAVGPASVARRPGQRPLPHRPVTLVPVRPVRPVVVRPVRPVTARPGTRPAARR